MELRDPEVQRFVRDKWGLIQDRFTPTHFILFGSRVTGTPHEWSDIDAIIVSERFASVRRVRRAYTFLATIEPDLPHDYPVLHAGGVREPSKGDWRRGRCLQGRGMA